MASNDGGSSVKDVDPRDIIFSCGICYATVTDIYKNPESNKGLSDGRGPDERDVTKFFLTECAHLTCGKHLEGGGAPFYPAGQHPKSPCPVCVRDENNRSLRELFAIRGFSQGEYDDDIPNNWFEVPPIELDAKVPGIEALRFQYLTLVKYSKSLTEQTRKTRVKYAKTQEMLSQGKNERRKLQSQIHLLKARVAELEPTEKALKKWKQKEPAIHHYLKVVTDMAKELEHLRGLAEHVGYQVSRRNYAFNPETAGGEAQHAKDANGDFEMVDKHNPNGNISGHDEVTHGRKRGSSATTLVDSGFVSNPSARKRRKHEQQESDSTQLQQPHSTILRRDSRDLMPPPVLPTLRRTQQQIPEAMDIDDAHIQDVNPDNGPVHHLDQATAQGPAMQIFQDKEWLDPMSRAQSVLLQHRPRDRPVPEQAMMSGALPFDDQTVYNRQEAARYSQPPQPRSQKRFQRVEAFENLDRPDFQRQQHMVPRDASRAGIPNSPIVPQKPSFPSAGDPRVSRQQVPLPFSQSRTEQQYSGQIRNIRRPPTATSAVHHLPRVQAARERLAVPTTPSPHNIGHIRQYGDASVASPFFRAEAPRERPSTSGSVYMHATHQNPGVQQIQQGYRMAPNPRASAYTQPEVARALNGLSFIQSPQIVSTSQPLYAHSPAPFRHARYSQAPVVPQTPRAPRDARGLLLRPDHLQSGQRQNNSQRRPLVIPRQAAPLPTAQPSLPALYGPQSRRGYLQDEALLASVPGVKGLGLNPRPNDSRVGGLYAAAPFAQSRGPYSSAGGRRSVRR